MNSWGGFRSDMAVALTGIDIEAKADLVERAFWRNCEYQREDFAEVATRVVRTDKTDPATNEEAVASWRITVKDPDQRKTASISSAMNDLALASIPGFFGLKTGGVGKPFGVHTSGLVARDLVPQHVVLLGGDRTVVDSDAVTVTPVAVTPVAVTPVAVDIPASPSGEVVRAPLGTLAGTRSGDKGGNANLGVFVRSAAAYAWLEGFLTVERLRRLIPETRDARIERFPLPNIWSINFVIHGILGEGVAASTRQDAQAKGLGEWLRARHVDIPESLLGESAEPERDGDGL